MSPVRCLKLACLLSAALWLWSQAAAPAQAGGCGYGYSYTPTYYAPSYYRPTYYAPEKEVVYKYKEVLVPYEQKVYANPEYYASIGDYYRDKLLVDAIAGRLQLMGYNQAPGAGQQFNYQGPQGYAPPAQDYQPNQLGQYNQPQGYAGGQQQPRGRAPAQASHGLGRKLVNPQAKLQKAGANGGVNPKLVQLVDTKCVQCHNGDSQQRVDLRDLAALDYGDRLEAFQKVIDGEMPQNDDPLEPEGVALFREWVKQGKQSARR
jgi:hypothetical protein